MARIGDTIRLKVQFNDFNNLPVDPDNNNVTLKVYDTSKNVLLTVSLAQDARQGVGNYQFDYTIPDGTGSVYYEFSGLVSGKPIVGRSSFPRTF